MFKFYNAIDHRVAECCTDRFYSIFKITITSSTIIVPTYMDIFTVPIHVLYTTRNINYIINF